MTSKEALAFIKAAALEVGPSSSEEWFKVCEQALLSQVNETETTREDPPDYYIDKENTHEQTTE